MLKQKSSADWPQSQMFTEDENRINAIADTMAEAVVAKSSTMLSNLAPDGPEIMTAWKNAIDRQAISDSIAEILVAECKTGALLKDTVTVKNEKMQLIFDNGNLYTIDRGNADTYTCAALSSSDLAAADKRGNSIPDPVLNVPPDDPYPAEYDEDYIYGPAPGM